VPDSPSRLAALVHELNQPLTAILSNAQAAQRFLASDPPDLQELREILEDIVTDDKRAAGIVRTLGAMLQEPPGSAAHGSTGSQGENSDVRKERAE
jgi:two-component system sensor kinase FixL